MKITQELVDYVSTLSRLRLPEEEKAKMAAELEQIVTYMDTLSTLDTEGVVVYAGSFSKVISPGMRVGYAIGPKAVLQKMVVCKQGEDVHSNMWVQIICPRIMTDTDYEAHLERLPPPHRRKCGSLLEDVVTYF